MSSSEEPRTGLIRSITAPLGFFVLALLIVEAFLATVLVGADLAPELRTAALWAGISAFVLVVFMVFLLVWFKPINLIFDKEAHLMSRP